MPRPPRESFSEDSIFARVVEQGWLAFLILGVFMVGMRLYNVKQRTEQRKLLREGIMAEMGYQKRNPKKAD